MQNKPVRFSDLKEFENKVMLSIDIPRFFYLDELAGFGQLTQAEVEYEQRMSDTVIYVTFREKINAR